MKKRTNYTLLLLFGSVLMFSCSSKYLVNDGTKDYDNLRYADAIETFRSALEKDPENEDAMKMLAKSYQRTHKYREAKKYYEMYVAKGNAEPSDKFEYAKMLMSNDEHDKAELYIREYLQINTDDKVAHSMLEACQFIEFFKDDTALYNMKKLPIFTNLSMFSPVQYKDGIAFTAERISEGVAENPWTNNSYYDIYYSIKKDGEWGTQIPFDLNINGKFHEGPITFNADGTKAVFTRSSNYNDNRKQALDEDDYNNLFLYEAELVDGKWSNVTELPFNETAYSSMHPTLSPDGNMLFFASDMPGGIGENDIYISTHNGQQWTDPVNLGDKINTPGDEVFPVLRGNELFFASDGLPSLGGLDMFVSEFEDDTWGKPRNMNYPINSTSDDFSLILLKGDTTGFFASNREGIDRIYEYVKKPSGRVYIDGTAREEETGEVLQNVNVILRNNITGEVLRELMTDENGKFELVLLPERMYKIEGNKEGYFRESYERSTIDQHYDEEVELLFSMAEIVTVGDDPLKRYSLSKIYYDLNDHRIRQDAALELNKLVTILNNNPTLNIRILSHTDSRASDQYNLDLSQRRAKSVVDYLEQKGISVDKLESQGMGETQLINECINGVTCSDKKHEENRRTEFVVTKY